MNVSFMSAAVLALPAVLATQQAPERAGFYLLTGIDTVVFERVSRTATTLSGDFADAKRGSHIGYTASLTPQGLISRLATRVYASGADTTGRLAVLTFTGDSVFADIGAGPHLAGVAAGAMAMINASGAFLEQALLHARAIGGDQHVVTFPVFIAQANQVTPVKVSFVGRDSATVEFANVALHLLISPAARLLGGDVPAQGLRIIRGAEPRAGPMVRSNRYAAPAGAPYIAEDVTVQTPVGIRLTGTLTIPRGRVSGPAPAIVTITGSGPQDRDDESPYIPGIRAFAELADTLGRRGIAVLRLDDRGINGSDAGPNTVTTADFADDIRAAVAYLRTRPEIDAARIGLVGHSEGGIIAPMIAATDARLRGIVLMAGTASAGREIMMQQNRLVIDSIQHLQGARRDAALAEAVRAMDSSARTVPWIRFFRDYDPATTARRVKTPVLILQGETDSQVPLREASALAAAFRSGGNTSVTVRTFPETNHLFLADANGAFYDSAGKFRYGTLPNLHVRPEVLGAIADWLSAQFR